MIGQFELLTLVARKFIRKLISQKLNQIVEFFEQGNFFEKIRIFRFYGFSNN